MRNLGDIIRQNGGVVAALNEGQTIATLNGRTLNVWQFQTIMIDGGAMYRNTACHTLAEDLVRLDEIHEEAQEILGRCYAN